MTDTGAVFVYITAPDRDAARARASPTPVVRI